MNTPVSRLLAKSLIEKGMIIHHTVYYESGKIVIHKYPTIADTVMWLYEKHGIWVSVSYKRHSQNKHFAYTIRQANGIETFLWEHISPTEAYEAAILFCLEKII